MMLRYSYLLRSSYTRMLEIIYWPHRADAHLGISAELFRQGGRRCSAGRRGAGGGHAHRRRAAVGHSAARPAGLFLLLHRGDVVAQSPQSADEPAAAGGIRRVADGDEPHPPRRRRGAGDDFRDLCSSASISGRSASPSAPFSSCSMLFAWSIGLFVSGLLLRLRARRGKSRLVADVLRAAARLPSIIPSSTLPGWLQPISWIAAADLCVRGPARRAASTMSSAGICWRRASPSTSCLFALACARLSACC